MCVRGVCVRVMCLLGVACVLCMWCVRLRAGVGAVCMGMIEGVGAAWSVAGWVEDRRAGRWGNVTRLTVPHMCPVQILPHALLQVCAM